LLWLLALVPLSCASMGAESPVDLRWAPYQVTDATAKHTDRLHEDNAAVLASTFEQAPFKV